MNRQLVYQVFVDRFAGADGAPLAPVPEGADPWKHHAGGTLDGIAARLDHVAALGADALWLTPVFRAPSNHKYDTEAWEVDPRFGGDVAFERLAAACRARGLGLILDGVFNHVGEWHAWCREERPWFRGTAWRGFGWLRELDVRRADVRAEIVAIVGKWLARGATGWRLDCANDLGVTVSGLLADAARAEGGSDGVIGEVMSWAEDFVAAGALDGVMNYWFRETVVSLVRGEIGAAQAAQNLEAQARRYREGALHASWNVLATHDTARLASAVEDPDARALAWALAFTAPGIPVVYYGEEIGLHAAGDPANRAPMPWDESLWDRGTLAFVKKLSSLRRSLPALSAGAYRPLTAPPSLLAFSRGEGASSVVVVANPSATPVKARLFAPVPRLFDALPLVDRLGDAPPAPLHAGAFDVSLRAWQVAVYVPDDTTIPGYSFFKGD